MTMLTRQKEIIKIVNQKQKVDVAVLADKLQVSKVTIRKDLTQLEELGLLKRQHGYAVMADPENLRARLAVNYDFKVKIAQKAAAFIQDGETIMLESGSTCALLAEFLGKSGKHVTIITVSYFIADYVGQYSNLEVFVTGGKYQAASEVVVGALAKQMISQFHVKHLFAGTDGFLPQQGFFCNNIERAEMVQAMARQATEVVILTDATKFMKASTVKQLELSQVSQVVTDDQIPADIEEYLRQSPVTLTII